MTHQREIILAELKKSTDHPTADELYERIKRQLPRISLATVYRNLEILSTAGMIRKLEISGRQKRFDWDLREHHHISCLRCQRVDNIELEVQEMLPAQAEDRQGYDISGWRVEFFGLCPKCRKDTNNSQGEETMACAPKGLSDNQRQVLEALAKSKEACGSKDIAAATSLEAKQVSCQITALKKKGFVESPIRCKYTITPEGQGALGE
ncbi:Fur family transcriptional regulator [Desulfogranum mediterraneum]|uniref:Fur family transcriptional regulator n=1 Tax=Desulfogranum mediterraneum TaxID=160661 RepID=UPI0003FAD0ED|nr:transcriptional repressor [Desulfogranum mediterraneum]